MRKWKAMKANHRWRAGKPVPPGTYRTVLDSVYFRGNRMYTRVRIIEGPYAGRIL